MRSWCVVRQASRDSSKNELKSCPATDNVRSSDYILLSIVIYNSLDLFSFACLSHILQPVTGPKRAKTLRIYICQAKILRATDIRLRHIAKTADPSFHAVLIVFFLRLWL